jgi:hypothetical protein
MLIKTDTVVGVGDLGNQSGAELPRTEFLAGPVSGVADYPTYRNIIAADLPGGNPTRIGAAFLPPIVGFKAYGVTTLSSLVLGYGGTPFVSAGGTITTVAPTATLPVAIRVPTASAANNGAALSPNTTSLGTSSLASIKSLKFNIRLVAITNVAMWIGLTDPLLSSSIVTAFKNNNTPNQNFVGFRFSTKASDPAWMCITQTDSTHQTANTSGSGADTTSMHEFEIQYDGTNAVFYVDGVQVGSQSGTIPASSVIMSPFLQIDNVNTANIASYDLYSYRWINNF